MYTIRTFNRISDIIYRTLKKDAYQVSDSAENYDAILVRSADLLHMDFPDRLTAIARAGAGTNNIPTADLTEKGVVVFNTPGANATAVKELVLCALLLSCRKIVSGIEWVNQQKEDGVSGIEKAAEKAKNQFAGPELAGKKLGVIGLGAVGGKVANAAALGLDMDVTGYDPYMNVDAALHLTRSVKLTTDLSELLAQSDYLTLHLPLTDSTRGLLNAGTIGKMKDGAVLLNFARGGLVEPKAVRQALESGKLRAYLSDFAADELVGVPGVTITPHLGASTPESEEKCADMAAGELDEYLSNGNIRHSVNLPDAVLPRQGEARVCVVNRNITNMVGQITSILASQGLNIEHMLNKSRGGYAYTLADVSGPVDSEAERKIAAIDGVLKVRVL